MTHANNVAIIGAGPAGLTAGYLLSKVNVPVTILEADPVYVGGIARTAKFKGYHFDIGGHRFFSQGEGSRSRPRHSLTQTPLLGKAKNRPCIRSPDGL